MGIIKLKNMQFYGYHGVYDHEKELGSPFEVDVEITRSFSKAASSDDVNQTVNSVSYTHLTLPTILRV